MPYEFDGVGPVAMIGGTEAHAEIQTALNTAVHTRLNRPPCRIVGSGLKIAAGRVRYPDAVILCSPREAGRTIAAEPIVVFEILSAGTTQVDLLHKNAEYRAIPSIQRYVILWRMKAAAIVFSRKGEDWVSEIVAGEGVELRLPEVGIAFPLDELYRDIALPAETDAPG